jgi:hypothetical protein
MSAPMSHEPSGPPDDDRPPLFSTWGRLYAAILVWEAVTIALIAAFSSWVY